MADILKLERLDTQLNKPTNQNSLEIRKRYYKTLGTSVINSPLSPLFLRKICLVNVIHTNRLILSVTMPI